MKNIYIGTSGYYYSWWHHNYYQNIPTKNYLEYYSQDFNTVEINNTFYKSPTKNLINNLADNLKINKNFVYSIKMNQYITHYTKLLNIRKYLYQFFKILEPIKNNTDCILFQFARNFKYSDKIYIRFEKLGEIYRDLIKKSIINKNTRFVFEFRNNSFYSDNNMIDLFIKYKFVFVLEHTYDLNFKSILDSKLITSDICYIRLHGTKGLYFGSYSNSDLNLLTKFIKKIKKSRNFIYFNNVDQNLEAIENAKKLQSYLK